MTTTQLRREMKRRIDALPEDRLASASDYLRYLDEHAALDVLEQQKIERMEKRIATAKQDIAEGRTRNWREIRDDV